MARKVCTSRTPHFRRSRSSKELTSSFPRAKATWSHSALSFQYQHIGRLSHAFWVNTLLHECMLCTPGSLVAPGVGLTLLLVSLPAPGLVKRSISVSVSPFPVDEPLPQKPPTLGCRSIT